MKHTIILASTGIVMGLLSSFVGLPTRVEFSLWIGFYVLWVVYGVRVKLEMPVRRMAFASTLSGLFAGSIQVLFMEQYRANNPWYSEVFETSTAQELSTNLLGYGIAKGIVFGVIVGLIVRWRQNQEAS
jgi:hypothetical protein